jgi:transposase-like protein
MPRITYTVEPIITKLREGEVARSKGQTVVQVSRSLGITEQTYYRWRHEYGGLKIDQVKRLKELEREQTRVKRAVAELTLDTVILQEAAEGNFSAQRADGSRWHTAGPRWASPNDGPLGCGVSRAQPSDITAGHRMMPWPGQPRSSGWPESLDGRGIDGSRCSCNGRAGA